MQVIITDYASHAEQIRGIRDEVFIVEQGVAREEEFDDRDVLCQHALVLQSSQPIATGRVDLKKDGKVGRVAVLKAFRRQGAGKAIMLALEAASRSADAPRLWCHAQVHAIEFYESLGYRVCSDEFQEAGIPHVKMQKDLLDSVD